MTTDFVKIRPFLSMEKGNMEHVVQNISVQMTFQGYKNILTGKTIVSTYSQKSLSKDEIVIR